MINFSVPSDFSPDTLKLYDKHNKTNNELKINEVYGQITTGPYTGSGRMIDSIPQIDLPQLKEYILHCKRYHIKFNYTLNASCYSNSELISGKKIQLQKFIEELYEAGVRSFTVAISSLINLMRKMYHDIEIKASAICEINCVDKAKHYQNLNVNRIVLDPDITRKFDEIKKISRIFGEGVEIIANNVCIKHCPYKMFHYNNEAHGASLNDKVSKQYYYHLCSLQKASNLINYLKLNWIRPEDLDLYTASGISNFKIQGRNSPDGKTMMKVLESYSSRSFDGNLIDLITLFHQYNSFQPYIDNKMLDSYIRAFYDNKDFCTGVCDECGYCMTYLNKATDVDKLKNLNKLASQLYQSYTNSI